MPSRPLPTPPLPIPAPPRLAAEHLSRRAHSDLDAIRAQLGITDEVCAVHLERERDRGAVEKEYYRPRQKLDRPDGDSGGGSGGNRFHTIRIGARAPAAKARKRIEVRGGGGKAPRRLQQSHHHYPEHLPQSPQDVADPAPFSPPITFDFGDSGDGWSSNDILPLPIQVPIPGPNAHVQFYAQRPSRRGDGDDTILGLRDSSDELSLVGSFHRVDDDEFMDDLYRMDEGSDEEGSIRREDSKNLVIDQFPMWSANH